MTSEKLNERRNSILMTRHYPDLGSASDWLNQISQVARPIRSTTQSWVLMRHQYGISALVFQTSFCGETSADVAKCPRFLRLVVCQGRVAMSFVLRIPKIAQSVSTLCHRASMGDEGSWTSLVYKIIRTFHFHLFFFWEVVEGVCDSASPNLDTISELYLRRSMEGSTLRKFTS